MSIHHLFDILLSYGPLPPKLLDKGFIESLKSYLITVLATSAYAKRQLLLSAGQVCEYIYFLEEGLARGFHIHHKTSKEITHFLWGKHCIVTVPGSFYKQEPSGFFIEVMPGTKLMSISYQQLMACINSFPEVEVFLRNVLLQYAAYESKRSDDLKFISTWERYLHLLQTHPDIEQQVSKEGIASYLNIAPQSFSRMLKNKRHP